MKFSDRWPKGKPIHPSLLKNERCYNGSFKKASLKDNSFEKLNLNGFDFSMADLRNVNFQKSTLKDTHFSEANLRNSSFQNATLDNVSFSDPKLQELLAFWCKWHQKIQSEEYSKDRDLDFWFMSLAHYVVFRKTDLRYSSFKKSILENTNISEADLRGVSFQGAKLKNVNINCAKTGITELQCNLIFTIALIISLAAGLIISYSLSLNLIDFFLPPEQVVSGDWRTVWWMTWAMFPGLFSLATILSFWRGMSGSFPTFFLTAIILSFVFIIPLPGSYGDYIALIALGLFSYVGLSAGMFAQAQSTYVVNEASYLSDCQNENLKIHLIFIYVASILGVLLGVIFAIVPNYDSHWEQKNIFLIVAIHFLFPTLVTFIGHVFGHKAYEEKEDYRLSLGEIPYEISIPGAFKNGPNGGNEELHSEFRGQETNLHEENKKLTLEDMAYDLENQIKTFVDKTVKERSDRKNLKFSIVRFLVDLGLDTFKTNFSGSSLTDVTFSGTNLSRANFSPAVVNFSPSMNMDLEKTTSLERFKKQINILQEQLILLRQTILEGSSTVINNPVSIVNNIIGSIIEGGSIGNLNLKTDSLEPSRTKILPAQDNGSNDMTSGNVNATSTTNLSGNGTISGNAKVGNIKIIVGNDPDASKRVEEIILNLKGSLNDFPEKQKEDAKTDLAHLEDQLKKLPEQQQPRQIGRYLKALIAACGAALMAIPSVSVQLSSQFKDTMSNLQSGSADAIEIIDNGRAIKEEIRSIQNDPVKFKALSDAGDENVVETIAVAAEQISELSKLLQPSQ